MTAGLPLKAVAVLGGPVVAALAALGAVTGGAALTAITTQLSPTPASAAALADIPPAMLALYQQAGQQACPQLPWQVLAAIGTVESGNGTSNLPGVHSGANAWGAEVIYRSDLGLRHVSDGGAGQRASAVSASSEARRARNGGLTLSLACPVHDGQLSGVACGVSF